MVDREEKHAYDATGSLVRGIVGNDYIADVTIKGMLSMHIPFNSFITGVCIYHRLEKKITKYTEISNKKIDSEPMYFLMHYPVVMEFRKSKYLLLNVCCIISWKYHEDISKRLSLWTNVMSIGSDVITSLELEILDILGYRIYTDDDDALLLQIDRYLLRNGFSRSSKQNLSKQKKNFCHFLKEMFCM